MSLSPFVSFFLVSLHLFSQVVYEFSQRVSLFIREPPASSVFYLSNDVYEFSIRVRVFVTDRMFGQNQPFVFQEASPSE